MKKKYLIQRKDCNNCKYLYSDFEEGIKRQQYSKICQSCRERNNYKQEG